MCTTERFFRTVGFEVWGDTLVEISVGDMSWYRPILNYQQINVTIREAHRAVCI